MYRRSVSSHDFAVENRDECECITCCCIHRQQCDNPFHQAGFDRRQYGETFVIRLLQTIGYTSQGWNPDLTPDDEALRERARAWPKKPFEVTALEVQGLMARHPNVGRQLRIAWEEWITRNS